MTVPNMIPASGVAVNVRPSTALTPYTPAWWKASHIEDIPESTVGWLVAQGWNITDAYQPVADGQTFYTLKRQGMQSWIILQTLLSEYVARYNEANVANVVRYENILTWWGSLVNATREQLDVLGDVSDAHVVVYFAKLDELVTDAKSEMDLALASATAAGAIVAAQLADYLLKLATLEGIYATHEADAEALLVNLGVAKLALINEKWDSALANSLQDLTNRGLYSSAIVTAITASITRKRAEDITNMQDQLAREKLENEHKLYAQEMDMLGMVMDGKLKNASTQFQYGQYLVEVRSKCALTVMEARMKRIQGSMEVRDREDRLMAYQLDERNKLMVGMFGFMERRSDDGPRIEDMTRLICGLGDSGGGWVTP